MGESETSEWKEDEDEDEDEEVGIRDRWKGCLSLKNDFILDRERCDEDGRYIFVCLFVLVFWFPK